MWVDRITSGLVNILIATDATWVVDDITAALGADGVTFTVCREGRVVADQIAERLPDLAILDLQIGSMGGMAVTMSLRLDESADTLPHVPVLMLLDRKADLHLARRSGAEGWLIKPLDALRLKRAAKAIMNGGTYTEGIPVPEAPTADQVEAHESTEEEPATAG
ncbi:MAG: DNA-binding response OmpR family regulator [Ilumatobacter sp.]|jgi:DNA-binding response OmpR family regulator|tara:strand:- start:1569 stop:2060 length:492 start_codon:yes stop_codon:yes gene_type:complete